MTLVHYLSISGMVLICLAIALACSKAFRVNQHRMDSYQAVTCGFIVLNCFATAGLSYYTDGLSFAVTGNITGAFMWFNIWLIFHFRRKYMVEIVITIPTEKLIYYAKIFKGKGYRYRVVAGDTADWSKIKIKARQSDVQDIAHICYQIEAFFLYPEKEN